MELEVVTWDCGIGTWDYGIGSWDLRLWTMAKNEPITEHSSSVEYSQYACNNCTIRITYHSFKGRKDISIK